MLDKAFNLGRRTLRSLARRAPISRRLFRMLDDLRAANAALLVERDQAIAMGEPSANLRESAEEARRQAVRERDEAQAAERALVERYEETDRAKKEAERLLWEAIGEREEADRARWKAVREREEADRARWEAVRQREERDRARSKSVRGRQSLGTGGDPTIVRLDENAKPTKRTWKPASGSPSLAVSRTADSRGAFGEAAAGPKISVLLPNYNHGRFIRDNIEAVRAQTYANWELVIVDDGSTDDSRKTIRSYAELDQRIIPIYFPENRGVTSAIEAALGAATGELLYGSAADDAISNNRFFELAVTALAEHAGAAGVFGKAVIIDTVSSEELWRMGSSSVNGFVGPRLALEAFLTGEMFVPGASAIWKRSHFDALGGMDPSLGPQTDYYINHALPAMIGAIFIDEVFTIVRTSENSYHQSGSDDEFFKRHALVEAKFRSLDLPVPLHPRLLRIWRERLIDSRLAVNRQQEIFSSTRAMLADLEPWERNGCSATFIDYSSHALADTSRLENELARRVSRARQTFDAIAGPLTHEDQPADAVRLWK